MKFFLPLLALILCAWHTPEQALFYHHNSDPQMQWAFETLSTHPILPTDHILDFGCGDGKITSLLSYRVPRGSITGVDISPTILDFARNLYPNAAFFHFAQAPSYRYDIITSFSALHLISHPLETLVWLRDHLKPTGVLIANMPYGGNYDFWHAICDEMRERNLTFPPTAPQSLRRATLEKIQEIFAQAGFTLARFELVPTHNVFQSKEEFANWFEAACTGYIHWTVDRAEKHSFSLAVVERMIASNPDIVDAQGYVHFRQRRIDIIAIAPERDKKAA